MIRASAWALVGAVCVCVVAGGCYSPNARVTADEMGEIDQATYLILTDQLQRVRNVLKKPAKVCIGTLPKGHSGGLAPVAPEVVARLNAEQAAFEPRLELVAEIECLAYYVTNKGYFEPERSDVLAYAGMLDYADDCGPWMGGLYSMGSLNRSAIYDVKVANGVAELTGGEDCRRIMWIRS
jgi:hypothetical protein